MTVEAGDGEVYADRDGAVVIVTLDRPARKNALNAAMCERLLEILAVHPDARAIVITGAGDAFCAGADLVTRFAEGHDSFRPAFDRLQDALEDHPAAVIAAVHGPALGAGTQLLTACDIVLASAAARFGIPAAKLGVMMSPPNIVRFVRRVGDLAARDLLLTARVIDVDEAVRIGLATRAVADAHDDALALARHVAGLAPLSNQGHKRALVTAARAELPDDATLVIMRELEAAAFASDDLAEGIAAFTEKRPPQFRGE